MRYELRLHRLLLSMMVTLLILFVIGLFYLNATPGEEHFEAVVSLILVIVVAAIFVYMGTAEGIIALYFGVRHRREFIAYLLLGLLSVSSGLYLAISEAESLQRISLIVSPHAFLFGLAELRMGRHLERHPNERRALIVCGSCELALGVSGRSDDPATDRPALLSGDSEECGIGSEMKREILRDRSEASRQ